MPRSLLIAVATILSALATGTPLAADQVDSPIYKSWAQFKVGTTARLRTLTVVNDSKIETTTTYKLVELTAEKVVVEMVVVSDATGKKVENLPQRLEYKRAFYLIPGVKKEDVGKPRRALDHGEETVKVAGKTYKAQWYDTRGRTEAGPSTTRTWMSDDVPGKLLKSVTKVPAAHKTTTLELVEIKTP